jgi:hypothetical protein
MTSLFWVQMRGICHEGVARSIYIDAHPNDKQWCEQAVKSPIWIYCQIWHIDISWENTGQVRIWSWSDDFWQSYAHWWNFQFPFIIFPMLYTFNLNFTYRCMLGISSSNSNLVVVQFWTKSSLLNVGKIFNFQFQHSYLCGHVVIILATNMQYAIYNRLTLNSFCALNFCIKMVCVYIE